MYVIGTAGHVDHGKSSLVRALTGIDPDRLREEQERGLTVDLGFAWLTLPSGRDVSVVDVPGHQRFIKNMLAGAGGIDLAVLVVSADEGPRHQTTEHLAILDVLGVPSLVVAMTKCDLADEEMLELVRMEVDELLEGTRYAGAPALPVSSTTRAGLDALLVAVDTALDATPEKVDRRRPRLAVDRVFASHGFGTVVTGTLVDGTLAVGQEVELQPGGVPGRVRGLQRHGQAAERLAPGTRAAVNVSGVDREQVQRGMVLALPGTLRPAHSVGVRLQAVPALETPVRRTAGVTFLAGTAETQARLRLLDADGLLPGEEAWAALLLDEPIALAEGDRFVIRTPNETAAGGLIVMLDPPVRRIRAAKLVELLRARAEGSPEDRLLSRLIEDGPVERSALGEEEVEAARTLLAGGDAVEAGAALYARIWLDARAEDAAVIVRERLADRPLHASVPQEHVRSRLRLAPPAFRAVLAAATAQGSLQLRGDADLTLPGYGIVLTPAQSEEVEQFMAELRQHGHGLTAEAFSDPELVHYLVDSRGVQDLGGGIVMHGETFAALTEQLTDHLRAHDQITLPEARDLLGLSRRYAQAYLERLDATGVTRRVGDRRVLRIHP